MGQTRIWTDEQLIEAVNSSNTLAEIISKLNLAVAGGTYSHIQKHMDRLNVSLKTTSKERQLSGIKNHQYNIRYTDNELFSINTAINRKSVRQRYLEKRKSHCCDICGLNEWLGNKLILHLDHINGNRNDHRLVNLRLICPNCHSHTETWGGKNKRKH